MVSFYVYDIALLILFTLGIFIFLNMHKKNMKREGIIFMYRTKLGINAINWTSNKFKKILHPLKYLIIFTGIVLMIIMIIILGLNVVIYAFTEITEQVKAPPIAPLIPYFPELFGMESFFPPFYFIYFIIALAIVAIVHEFSHGIYMKLFKIKIKSTGFVFLGPILGAFVEEEKSQFEKKKKLQQMTVLGAGVFANVVIAFIFYGLYVLFFFSSFSQSGFIFNSYSGAKIPVENISSIEVEGNLYKLSAFNYTFYLDENLAKQLNETGLEYYTVYFDSPAFKSQLKGVITQIDDIKIKNQNDLGIFLESKKPGDESNFVTEYKGEVKNYKILFGKNPINSSKAYLGVAGSVSSPHGVIQKVLFLFMNFKEPSSYYKPTWNSDAVYFIYYFIWWIMLINFLVALFNMLPLGILDGGRFFYLAVLSVTRSEKFAKKAFKFMNYLIVFIFVLLMFIWFVKVF
jgi:membrane-associated protease RseP (regulator of RpoE activity)